MKNKKIEIGYIYSGKKEGRDEKFFLNIAKKKNVNLVMLNICFNFNEEIIKDKFKNCDIIYCNTAEPFAIEFIKTLEKLGKRVIDSSNSHLYIQDKWLFYLECKIRKIPTPKTILLSEGFNIVRKQLISFNIWPIVLKRLDGTMGEDVEKADNCEESIEIIKRFWGEHNERFPLIAQEFVDSPCYRVTLVNKEVVQTAMKTGNYWKKTGVYSKKVKKFKIDSELKKLLRKINEFVDIKICGVDFLKKEKKWLVLEVNSEPAFDFFENEQEKIISKVVDYLKKEALKTI
ncbi:MAG: ATP-grasp domain-containing protein [Candidatus Pacearchaeota archaeon]